MQTQQNLDMDLEEFYSLAKLISPEVFNSDMYISDGKNLNDNNIIHELDNIADIPLEPLVGGKKQFYPSMNILTKFTEPNTHRTVFAGGNHMAFNINNQLTGYNDTIKSLVRDLIKYQGDDFYLNEVPDEVDHLIYIDIDSKISFQSIGYIRDFLIEIVKDILLYKVLINEETGKIHIVVNIKIHTSRQSNLKKSILIFLRDYLYGAVESELSREEWIAAFDINAPGIRSAFSIKMVENEIISRSRYLPLGYNYQINAETITEYSIYNFQQLTTFTSEIWQLIDECQQQLLDEIVDKQAKKAARDDELIDSSEYDPQTNSIPINGLRKPVNQQLINDLINAVPIEWGQDKKWWVMLQKVHAAGQLIKDFDPDFFLHQWSANASPNEYNKIQNNNKYFRIPDVSIELAGASLTWIRNKGNALNIYTHPSVSSHEFFDYMSCKLDELPKFVQNNIAYIDDGGRPYYITRMLKSGDIQFNIAKSKNLAEIPKKWHIDNKSIKLLNIIENQIEKISYSRADFMPPHIGPVDKIFNTFTGFKHKPLDKFNPALIQPITQHIKEVWCKFEEKIYDYLLNLWAHIVQKPNIKTDTALIIKSTEQGAGKGIIVDFLGDHVIGSKYYYYTENVEKLFDKFNSEQANKLLTLVDETSASEKTSKDISEELKAYITRKKHWIEYKGVNKIELNDYNNYIFASNKDTPLYIDRYDRRFFILEADDKYCKDNDYFVRLSTAMTPEAGQHFFTMLMQRDISSFNPRLRPSTIAKNTMIEESLPLYLKYIINYVRTNIDITDISMSSDDLFIKFTQWCGECNIKNIPSKIGFARDINKIIPVKVKKVNGKSINWREISFTLLKGKIKKACNFDIELVVNEEDAVDLI